MRLGTSYLREQWQRARPIIAMRRTRTVACGDSALGRAAVNSVNYTSRRHCVYGRRSLIMFLRPSLGRQSAVTQSALLVVCRIVCRRHGTSTRVALGDTRQRQSQRPVTTEPSTDPHTRGRADRQPRHSRVRSVSCVLRPVGRVNV